MENFIVIIFFLLLGMVLKRSVVFHEQTGTIFNLFSLHIALPAVILLNIHGLTFSTSLLVPAVLPWVLLFLSVGLVLLFGRVFAWPRDVVGALLLVVPLGNTSFFGIPMIHTFFGESGIPYAVLYDQLGTFIGLAFYGSLIISLYTGDDKVSLKAMVKRVFTFPAFLALLTGFLLRPVELPGLVINLCEMLGATLIPLVMIAVGFQLKFKLEKDIIGPMAGGLLIKLVIAPLTGLGLCLLIGATGEPADVAVFEAAMPPMITAGALAMLNNLAPRLSAAMIGLGLIVSFVTLPLLFQLLSYF
jgi:predicted permease